ncbi:MAG: thioredoxin family protein [Tannerella sp.]|jgi:thiol:disulfide interchange protein DsbD|nr:thioredoxin family protein [Tannerella sp.]
MKKSIIWVSYLLTVFLAEAQILTPVKWKIELTDAASAEKEVRFTMTAEKGWHVYDMDLPEGGPVPAGFTFEILKGAELIGKPAASVAPVTVHDDMFGMDVRWYAGTVTFTQKIKVTNPKKFKLAGEVEFMACNDEMCLPPERVRFAFDGNHLKNGLPLSAGTEAEAEVDPDSAAAEPNRDTTPEETREARPGPEPVIADLRPAAVEKRKPAPQGVLTENPALWTPVMDELSAFGDTTTKARDASWRYIFWAGFLGGLIALLTPCVWPMIPMTVSFFLKRNRKRSKAIREAILYGLSILVIYLTLGLLITGIFGAGTLNSLSTNAIFNILFFLLLLLFAVSFFGAFEFALPASWTNRVDARADTLSGVWSIFFMAFTLALVSFSCTGPIIGTLLVEAASGGNVLWPAVGMAGFALALAIPFALFAVFPHLMHSLPKSGGWLNSVKIVLAFLELALALKFLSVADLAYGWRILDREVFLTLWIVIFALLGGYLLGKIRFRYDSREPHVSVPRLFMAIVSFAFAVYMIPGLWGAPLKAISAFAPPLYTQDFSLYENDVRAIFDHYETGMSYAEKARKPVLIDFSGYGCVNCRKMEAAVWTDPKVKALLEEKFVLVSLMVDDREKLPQPVVVEENGKKRTLKTVGEKWSYLQRHKFGANAQPFYVILDAGGKPLAPSYAYNEEVAGYVQFLENGLKNYK